MDSIYVKKAEAALKDRTELEKKLNVTLSINGNIVTVEGESVDEYAAILVLSAVNFGFNLRKALVLKDENMAFKIVHIKSYTKRDLRGVKARLIGTHGKTRKTIAEISGCDVLIREGEVGIIGDVESVENAETAIINLIRGSKQANMYRYLERMNRERKKNNFSF